VFKNLFNSAQNCRGKCWYRHIFYKYQYHLGTKVGTFDNTSGVMLSDRVRGVVGPSRSGVSKLSPGGLLSCRV